MSAFVRDRDRGSGSKGVIGLPRHPLQSQTEYLWILLMRFTKKRKNRPSKSTLNNFSNLMILTFFACTEINQRNCVQHIWVVVLSLGAVKGEMGLPGGQDRVGNVYSQKWAKPHWWLHTPKNSISLSENSCPNVSATNCVIQRISYFKC